MLGIGLGTWMQILVYVFNFFYQCNLLFAVILSPGCGLSTVIKVIFDLINMI